MCLNVFVKHKQVELCTHVVRQALRDAGCILHDCTCSEGTDGFCFHLVLSWVIDHQGCSGWLCS